MPKKSFDTNVAMKWISSDVKMASGKESVAKTEGIQQGEEKTAENTETQEIQTVTQEKKPAPVSSEQRTRKTAFKISREKEIKSRQTSLLLKESTYEKIEKLAKSNGVSVNNCINQILEQVIQ